jgi:HK97 family phage major capsid protein
MDKMPNMAKIQESFDFCMQTFNLPNPALAPEDMTMENEIQARWDDPRNQGVGRKTDPQMPGNGPHNSVKAFSPGRQAGADMPKTYGKFKSPADFLSSVKDSCAHGGRYDPRLVYDTPTSLSGEFAGESGGFLVPPAFSQDIWQPIVEGPILPRCYQIPVSGNSYVQTKDESPPWDISKGVQIYWAGEGQALQQSKIALSVVTKRLSKLTALVPVSDELMEDQASLVSYLQRKVTEKFDFGINLSIIQGNGTGQPLGFLTSGALITVAAELGQDSGTIIGENILKMYSRLTPGAQGRAVWLCSPDVKPQLYKIHVLIPNAAGFDSIGGWPLFVPAGQGFSPAPYDTLLGREVIYTESANPLGSLGDIALCDLGAYQTIIKGGGLRSDISTHVFFEFDSLCFRFVARLDGAPLMSAPVAARTGNGTYSAFIALAAR